MKIPEPRKLKSGSWFIQLRLNGVSVPVTASTRKECIETAQLIKAEHRAGKRAVERSDATPTLGAAIDGYIEKRKNVLSPSTVRGYQAIRRSRFLPVMDKKISAIDWQKAVNDEARICSPKSVKNAWGLVRSVLAENGIDVSVRLPASAPHEKEWLTADQIPTFIEAVSGQPCEIGALLALSGLRRSEIYGLDWKDVDLQKGVIRVRQSLVLDENAAPVVRKQNKTASSTRNVPIFLPRLSDALAAVEDKTGPVVQGNIGTLRKQLHRVCVTAGLPDIGVHGLRHSFASLCYSLGISEIGAMQLGGWSDYQTMRKIYTHISEKDKLQSADKLKEFFVNAN